MNTVLVFLMLLGPIRGEPTKPTKMRQVAEITCDTPSTFVTETTKIYLTKKYVHTQGGSTFLGWAKAEVLGETYEFVIFTEEHGLVLMTFPRALSGSEAHRVFESGHGIASWIELPRVPGATLDFLAKDFGMVPTDQGVSWVTFDNRWFEECRKKPRAKECAKGAIGEKYTAKLAELPIVGKALYCGMPPSPEEPSKK